MSHVVFAWEIGAGFGHLIPIAALGHAFRLLGYRVSAIVPYLSPAQSILEPLGIRVMELASPAAPYRTFPISINYTANLLRNGFWHAPTIAKRIQGWHQVLNQLKPSLLVCDHAPSALLASRNADYGRVAIGAGYTLPSLSTPMSGIQPWFSVPAERLAQKDQDFLDTVNPILLKAGIPPLKTVASLFDGVKRFLCIEAELDHYPIRSHETYWGAIEPVSMPSSTTEQLWGSKSGVFVYMSATNRFLDPLMHSLKKRDIPVLAYISGLSAHNNVSLVQAENIHYETTFVNLKEISKTCRAAITHGGTMSASMLLRQGIKLLICPHALDKAIFATRLQERNLAYGVNWFSPQGPTEAQLDELLSLALRPRNLSAFVQQQAESRGNPVADIVAQCERMIKLQPL